MASGLGARSHAGSHGWVACRPGCWLSGATTLSGGCGVGTELAKNSTFACRLSWKAP